MEVLIVWIVILASVGLVLACEGAAACGPGWLRRRALEREAREYGIDPIPGEDENGLRARIIKARDK